MPTEKDTNKTEGAFSVWEAGEIRDLLDERMTTKSGESIPVSSVFMRHYGVEPGGNVKPQQVQHTTEGQPAVIYLVIENLS